MHPVQVYSSIGQLLGVGQLGFADESQVIVLQFDAEVAALVAKTGGEIRLSKEDAFKAFMDGARPSMGTQPEPEKVKPPVSAAHQVRARAAIAGQVSRLGAVYPELQDVLIPIQTIAQTLFLGVLSITSARRRIKSITAVETAILPLTVEAGRLVYRPILEKPTDKATVIRFSIPKTGDDRIHIELERDNEVLPFLSAFASSAPGMDLVPTTGWGAMQEWMLPWIFRTFTAMDSKPRAPKTKSAPDLHVVDDAPEA